MAIELFIVSRENAVEVPKTRTKTHWHRGEAMSVTTAEAKKTAAIKAYRYLEPRADKSSQELFVLGRGIRASTIWHDLYIQRFSPEQIASDRGLPIEAVYEALAFCQENWEMICREKDDERQYLEEIGFFSQ